MRKETTNIFEKHRPQLQQLENRNRQLKGRRGQISDYREVKRRTTHHVSAKQWRDQLRPHRPHASRRENTELYRQNEISGIPNDDGGASARERYNLSFVVGAEILGWGLLTCSWFRCMVQLKDGGQKWQWLKRRANACLGLSKRCGERPPTAGGKGRVRIDS